MNKYLIHYLRNVKEDSDSLSRKYIDYFKIELDWYIYRYGNHFAQKSTNIKTSVYKLLQQLNSLYLSEKITKQSNNILSSISGLDIAFWNNLGYNALSSIWQPVGYKNIIGNTKTLLLKKKIERIINKGAFNDLYNSDLFSEIEQVQYDNVKHYSQYNFKGVCLYTDQYFESKYLIDVFKSLGKPSLVFSHGLPAIYSLDVDNRSDYLMVWGEKIKENYVKAGFNSDKIKVVGNLKYKNTKQIHSLKNTLDNVLVIPCSSILWHQHEWDNTHLVDRSMIVLYLYQVQRVLERMNVKHARFRPHPTFDIDWVCQFIDNDFYIKDDKPLVESFNESSLVIGATSTTFLEALNAGVNYVLYEPTDADGKNLCGFKLVPPFDGSEDMIHIANNEEELEYMLSNKYQNNIKILDGYMQPIDPYVIKTILK